MLLHEVGGLHERGRVVDKEGDFGGSSIYERVGGGVWTCVEDKFVGEKEEYKVIGICVFDYKLLEEQERGGRRGHRWVSIFESSY